MNGPPGIVGAAAATELAAAPPDLRLHRQGPEPGKRAGAAMRFFASLLVHAIGVGALIYVAANAPAPPPPTMEIPVELVPPPEEPAPAPEKQPQTPAKQPQEATLDEKPATDAPRPESEEKTDQDAPDKQTRGPHEAKVTERSATQQEAGGAAPDVQEKKDDAEPLSDAAQEPAPAPKPRAIPDKPPSKPGALSDRELLAAFQPLPDYEFGASGRKTPVAGGSAKSTYLTVLFGMVMPKMRVPAGVHHAQGKITFGVDSWGTLTHIGVQKSSGSPELDYAAMAAVRAAAPFPAPPNHRSIGLTFTYGAH